MRLVDHASRLVAGFGRGRETFFDRALLVGAAFAAAPVMFATRPVSARDVTTGPLSSYLSPRQCRSGHCRGSSTCCSSGYSAFCCTFTGSNYGCPPYAFIGGWWRCTQRIGTGICRTTGTRYYIDCNTRPGHSCPNGCSCPKGQCWNRHTCCNFFKYGQCNTGTPDVGYVVCRLLSCVPPYGAQMQCGNCHSTPNAADNYTCHHPDGVACL